MTLLLVGIVIMMVGVVLMAIAGFRPHPEGIYCRVEKPPKSCIGVKLGNKDKEEE